MLLNSKKYKGTNGYQIRYNELYLTGISLAIFLVFSCITLKPNQPNDIRSRLTVTPSDVYPKIIAIIPSGNWNKISECVNSIRPLLVFIDDTHNQSLISELDKSINAQNKEMVGAVITKLALLGSMDYLLNATDESSSLNPQRITRVSFAEYLSVEKQFKKKHFKRCQQIVMLFRRSYSSTKNIEQFQKNVNELTRNLKIIADDLEL